MATIASLVVKLVADAAGFSEGFRAAESKVKNFAKQMRSLSATSHQAFSDPTAAASDLLGRVPVLGAALALIPDAIGAINAALKEGEQSILAWNAQAVRMGTTIEDIQPILALGGDQADAYAKGIAHMQVAIADAASGSQEAQISLGRLGLKYEDLINLSAGDQFKVVAESLKGVDNATRRTASGMEIFGKASREMSKGLRGGSKGIESKQAELDALGASLTSEESALVVQFDKAEKLAKMREKAVKQRAAIAAAQIKADRLAAVARKQESMGFKFKQQGSMNLNTGPIQRDMTKPKTKPKPFEKDLTKQLFMAAEFTAKLDDLSRAYGRNAHMIELNALARKGATTPMLAAARARMEEFDTLNRITDSQTKSLNIFDDYAIKSAALQSAFRTGKISADGLAGGLVKINDALDKSSTALAAETFKAVATAQESYMAKVQGLGAMLARTDLDWITFSRAVGMATQALLDTPTQTLSIFEDYRTKAVAMQGAFDKMGLSIVGLLGGFNSLNETMRKSIFAKGAEVFKSVVTPVEAFMAKVEELNQLVDTGVKNGGIAWETYARAVSAAGKALTDTNKAQETKLAGSAAFGSQEAYSAIAKAGGASPQGGLDTLKDAIKAQLEVQKKQRKDLDDIARAAKAGFLRVGVIR